MKCVICGREIDENNDGVYIYYDDGRIACEKCSIKCLKWLGDVLAYITSYEDLKKEADE